MKLHARFDSKYYERLGTNPAEVAGCTATKCWEDQKVPGSFPIGTTQLGEWIERREPGTDVVRPIPVSKAEKASELKSLLESTLSHILRNPEFFKVIKV